MGKLKQPKSIQKIWLGVLLLALLLSACGKKSESLPEAWQEMDLKGHNQLVYNGLWNTINSAYVYRHSDEMDWEAIQTEYQTKIENAATKEEFEALMQEMLSLLPENTISWQTRGERIEEEMQPPNIELGGALGLFLSYAEEPEPHCVVLEVLPNSPAYLAGIQDHDSIYAIDGEAVTSEDQTEALTGSPESSVSLEVNTPEGPFGETTLTREEVDFFGTRRFLSAFVPETQLLYVRFPHLGYQEMGLDFARMVRSFNEEEEIEGLILDMRIASTGTGWPLEDLLMLFMDGDIGDYYSLTTHEDITVASAEDVFTKDIPVVLLVGPHTSGLPEIFAAALQDSRDFPLVGLPTAGDMEAFENRVIPDGSVLRLATRSFRDAGSEEIGLHGVQPDLVVDLGWDEVTSQNDGVIYKALELLLEMP